MLSVPPPPREQASAWVAMSHGSSQYKIKSDSVEVIASRLYPKVGKTLTEKKWRAAFDREGRVDISKVLMRIQGGGVHPSIRAEVWEFLLGCFAADSTHSERAAIRKARREKYFQVKAKCQDMDPAVGSGVVVTLPRISEDGIAAQIQQRSTIDDVNIESDTGRLPRSLVNLQHQNDVSVDNGTVGAQEGSGNQIKKTRIAQLQRSSAIKIDPTKTVLEVDEPASTKSMQDKKIIQWRLTLHQIGLDVLRTDRTLEFYEKPSNLAKLWDILAVYSWLDPEVGYCQGMSDLCSPMVVLLENEADAFWCFERLMYRSRENFKCTAQAVGVQKQLANLGIVLQVVDPKLHKHLDDLGGGNFIYAFRMLMVLFRREFSFSDSLYLWEIIWSLEYDPDAILPEAASHPQKAGYFSRKIMGNGWITRRGKSLYKWGKFERQKNKYGQESNPHEIPFVVFCAVSIFESQKSRLQESHGLDDVLRILNDVTGKLDARKACKEALKIHKKYLLKETTNSKQWAISGKP